MNTNGLQKGASEKPSKEHLDTIAMCLHTLSLAKNIKLMEGTLSVWERLADADIKAGVFNMKEFVDAINVGVRMQMYNRIDYADIYQEAEKKAKSRKIHEKDMEEYKERQRHSTVDISMRRPLAEIKRLMNGEDL